MATDNGVRRCTVCDILFRCESRVVSANLLGPLAATLP